MLCPFCSYNDSKVIDSRDTADGVRRRRECLRCGLRFTTYERVQTRALMVIKRDGRREEFNRNKLQDSLTKACAKRPLPVGSIEKVIDDIEARLDNLGRAEIPSRVIGELVMEKLKELDRVAYIRFASVYRDFRDIESFKQEIETLLERRDAPVSTNQLSFLDGLEGGGVPKGRGRRRGRRPKRPAPGPAEGPQATQA
jgi:transcriptional repressor NrdR